MHYVSAGYVILSGKKRGVKYYPIMGSKIVEENAIYFSVRSQTNNPVGTVVILEKEENSFHFKGTIWKHDYNIPDEFFDKYHTESLINEKALKFIRDSKGLPAWDIIKDKTLSDLMKMTGYERNKMNALRVLVLEHL